MDLGFNFSMLGQASPRGRQVFYQPFDNAEATLNVFGGTSTDPTTLPWVRAVESRLRGVVAPPSYNSSTVRNTLFGSTSTLVKISWTALCDVDGVYSQNKTTIFDDGITPILAVIFYNGIGSAQCITVHNKSDEEIARLYSSTTRITDPAYFELYVNLNTYRASIFCTHPAVDNNIDFDISDGNTCLSKNVKHIDLAITAGKPATTQHRNYYEFLAVYEGRTI